LDSYSLLAYITHGGAFWQAVPVYIKMILQ